MWQLRNLIARPTLRRSFRAVRELGIGSEERITLIVEPTDEEESGPCDCCGDVTKTVWGFVGTDAATLAAYYVQWVPGLTSGRHAMFDLLIGRWGDGASRFHRGLLCAYVVSLADVKEIEAEILVALREISVQGIER